MSRYIDADRLKKHFEWWEGEEKAKEFKEIFDEIIDAQPTADVVEMFIDELTKDISDRVIQVLEASDEIIVKKPVLRVSEYDYLPKNYVEYRRTVEWEPLVRCKDCKWYEETDARIGTCLLVERGAEINGFCAWGERREDD